MSSFTVVYFFFKFLIILAGFFSRQKIYSHTVSCRVHKTQKHISIHGTLIIMEICMLNFDNSLQMQITEVSDNKPTQLQI